MADSSKEIGSLYLSIASNSSGLSKGLNNLTSQLDKMADATERINNTNLSGFSSKMKSLANSMSVFSKSISIDDESIAKVSVTTTSFQKLGSFISKVANTDMEQLNTQFTRLNTIMTPFLNKLSENQVVLSNFSNALDASKTIGQYDKLLAQTALLNERTRTQAEKTKLAELRTQNYNNRLKQTNEQMSKLNTRTTFWVNLWKIGKLAFAFRLLQRFGNAIAKFISYASDYTETLNKFSVAMRGSYNQAINFANQLSESFGLATETIMNYQATFKNMLSSLKGLSEETSYQLSKTLTEFAIDYASLYNTSLEDAMTAFQSVLSGKTTAIRTASGIDVTDTTLYQLYQELGGTKSQNSLTQIEKRLLRIYAIQQQMMSAGAIGDYKKTIESLSNQVKVFEEQLKEFKTWAGYAFKALSQNVMPYINGLLMALVQVFKTLAYSLGYTDEENPVAVIGEAAESATDSVNELSNALNGLFSFDKFEVLGSGGSSESASAIDNVISNQINAMLDQYNNLLDGMEMKATKIRDSILEWLGYEKIDGVVAKLKEGYQNIEKIANVIKTLMVMGIAKALMKLYSAILKVVTATNMTTKSVQLLQNLAIFAIIYSVITLITQYEELDKWQRALYISVIALSTAFLILKNRLAITKLLGTISALFTMLEIKAGTLATTLLGVGTMLLFIAGATAIFVFMDKFDAKTKTLVGVISMLTAALTIGAAAWLAFNTAMSWGAAAPIIVGATALGVAGLVATIEGVRGKGIGEFANGGFPDEGQMFIARESGPELVGTMGGKTAVANNGQITEGIRQASYQGIKQALDENGSSKEMTLKIDGSNINNSAFVRAIMPAFKVEQKRTGGF